MTLPSKIDADHETESLAGLDQKTLRMIQEAFQYESIDQMNFDREAVSHVLRKIRDEIFLRRYEYEGLAQWLEEQGFEYLKRDTNQYDGWVEEMRMVNWEEQILVTADYYVDSKQGIRGVITFWEFDKDAYQDYRDERTPKPYQTPEDSDDVVIMRQEDFDDEVENFYIDADVLLSVSGKKRVELSEVATRKYAEEKDLELPDYEFNLPEEGEE